MLTVLAGVLSMLSAAYACDKISIDDATELYQTASKQEAGTIDVLLAKKHLLDVTLCAQGTTTHEYCKVAVEIQSQIKDISLAKFKIGLCTITDCVAAMNELDRVKAVCK